MSTKATITRRFRHLLPKVKGYRWEIEYRFKEDRYLGNVSVLLWQKWSIFPDIVGSKYIHVGESLCNERVDELVSNACAEAIAEAERAGYRMDGTKPSLPSNLRAK